MKRISKENRKLFRFFFIIISLALLSACDGITPTSPVINSFTADDTTIDEGDSVNLNWTVADATIVTINQGIGTVALSGSTSVSPASTTTYTLTATNSAGSTTATVTITVNPLIVLKTITIQPGPVEGKDAYVASNFPSTNFGSNHYINIGKMAIVPLELARVGYEYYDFYRSYFQFDLTDLQVGAIIVEADLEVYQYYTSELADFMISIHQVTESWEENSIIWTDQPYYPSPESTITVSPGLATWLSWDITSLVQGWLDGEIENHGIVLKDTNESSSNISWCYSSDWMSNPSLCPKLEITYYVP